MKKLGILLVAVIAFTFTACEEEETFTFENGTYKAEFSEFSRNWKAFVEATIKDDELTSVDFDYVSPEGNLKSETTVENYPMDPHPTVWLPQYEQNLMNADLKSFTEVDAVTGATGAWNNLNTLMSVLLDAAKEGDTSTQVVVAE